MRLFAAATVLAIAAPILAAQQSGGGGGSPMGGMGQSSGGSDSGGGSKRSANDDLSAVAPPFDVEDVLRMHRVGLQDEVIIQALRARFHPMTLTPADLDLLTKNSVSAALISAMEDPFGTGLRPQAAATVAPPTGPTPVPSPAKASEISQAAPIAPVKQPDKVAPDKEAKVAKDTNAAASKLSQAKNPVPLPEKTSVPTASKDAAVAVSSSSNSASTSLKSSADHIQSASSSVPMTNQAGKVDASMRLPVPNPGADSAPAVHFEVGDAPKSPGIYRRLSGGGWGQVSAETISWKHSEEDPTKHVEGRLNGVVSPTSTAATSADLLIVTPPNTSVVRYQLLKLRSNHAGRDFRPEQGANEPSGSADVLGYNPQRLGPDVWLVSLHNLPHGDYGVLPPIQGELRSTTGFAKSIFTFHVL